MWQESYESHNPANEQTQNFTQRDREAHNNLDEYRMGVPLKGTIAQNDFASHRLLALRKESDSAGSSNYPYPAEQQTPRHAYETSQMYEHRLHGESHSNPASISHTIERDSHVWTASFQAGDTTCDVTLPPLAIMNMPENCNTMPRIQEIPDLDGNSRGYHTVMFNLSKHDGQIDFNVLGLSHQHAYSESQSWDRTDWPVRLLESTRANHAALSQTRFAHGTATPSDVSEMNKRQIVQLDRPFLRR